MEMTSTPTIGEGCGNNLYLAVTVVRISCRELWLLKTLTYIIFCALNKYYVSQNVYIKLVCISIYIVKTHFIIRMALITCLNSIFNYAGLIFQIFNNQKESK